MIKIARSSVTEINQKQQNYLMRNFKKKISPSLKKNYLRHSLSKAKLQIEFINWWMEKIEGGDNESVFGLTCEKKKNSN